ncbi:MAG: tetratricopeptide repeat protein [Candidatus Cloacimonetes bacterium]|nr:tetratricopeptide repeat protein [Candidatus Cloacimonadota bacterium]
MLEKYRTKKLQNKGQKLLVKGKIQKAYDIFQKVILLDNSTENIFNLAISLLSLNRFSEAESYFQKIYENYPENELNMLSYADCLMLQRKWQEAIPIFRSLSENNPKNKKYQFYEQISEDVIQREKYVRSRELFNSAREELNKKHDEKALKILLEAYEYNDKNPILLNNIASLYIMKKDYAKAYNYLESAFKLDKENIRIIKNMVLVKKKLKK